MTVVEIVQRLLFSMSQTYVYVTLCSLAIMVFSLVLQCIRAASSNFHLDEELFGVYAVETDRMIVSQYGRFRMPQSVHNS